MSNYKKTPKQRSMTRSTKIKDLAPHVYKVRPIVCFRASRQGYLPLVSTKQKSFNPLDFMCNSDTCEHPVNNRETGEPLNLFECRLNNKKNLHVVFSLEGKMARPISMNEAVARVAPENPFGLLRSKMQEAEPDFDFGMRYAQSLLHLDKSVMYDYVMDIMDNYCRTRLGFSNLRGLKGTAKQKSWASTLIVSALRAEALFEADRDAFGHWGKEMANNIIRSADWFRHQTECKAIISEATKSTFEVRESGLRSELMWTDVNEYTNVALFGTFIDRFKHERDELFGPIMGLDASFWSN